ncbi:MAG TPA: hypothetical protein V6D50_01780 [Chroococcales cyanobacterium]|jgi:hypothetical protein
MNRFAGVIITVVALAALIGAALGWRFPFPGSRSETASVNGRSSPRLTAGQPIRTGNTVSQPTNTTTARNSSGTTVAKNSNSTTPELPAETTGGDTTTNEGVSAMW